MVNPIHLFTIKEQSTHSNPTMHHDHLLKITPLEFLDKLNGKCYPILELVQVVYLCQEQGKGRLSKIKVKLFFPVYVYTTFYYLNKFYRLSLP